MPGHDVTLTAVGDLMLGDSAKCTGFGVRSRSVESGSDRLFEEAVPYLVGDIVFGNLECVVSDHDYSRWSLKRAQMRGAPDTIPALRKAGFNVVNVANNHAMQHGGTGFANTCNALSEAGIGVVGRRGSGCYHCAPLILTIRGTKVGLLGYGCEKDHYAPDQTCYARGIDALVTGDIARLREECDLVVVSLHWGEEFMPEPSQRMVRLGRLVIDAGGSLVLGHHPHVLQRVETYRHGVICYSLGNFLSDMLWDEELRQGAAVSFELGSVTRILRMTRFRTRDDYSVARSAVFESFRDPDRCSWPSDRYEAQVERFRVQHRNRSHLYLARNFYKYNPLVLAQLLCKSFRGALNL